MAECGEMRPNRLIVAGWRSIPHSYAIVNQWQLLALMRRNLAIKVIDAPFYRRSWQPRAGLFVPESESALASLPIAAPDEAADVTLRIFAPFTFVPTTSRLTAVFATLEEQAIRPHQIGDPSEYQRLRRHPPPAEVKAVTPSHWSAQGFYQAGFDASQVVIVPHGADIETFHPSPDGRRRGRAMLAAPDDTFVFLSVGAMSGNKGIDLLLRAFAAIRRTHPQARLILKGMDRLYDSRQVIDRLLGLLSAADAQIAIDGLIYLGNSLSHRELAILYQAADVYVSPYRAEGFNIPVLEAAACGLPTICTAGGPTDEFVTDEFAWRISSRKLMREVEGQQAARLEPDLDHLVELMRAAIENQAWRTHARAAGPLHVARAYTWDHVAGRLIEALFEP